MHCIINEWCQSIKYHLQFEKWYHRENDKSGDLHTHSYCININSVFALHVKALLYHSLLLDMTSINICITVIKKNRQNKVALYTETAIIIMSKRLHRHHHHQTTQMNFPYRMDYHVPWMSNQYHHISKKNIK